METNTLYLFIIRWQKLLADSDARKHRLLRMQDQFRQIEELYLTFAKKASAFNSWFENAEEDLTDPVRCNSIEEIRALREAHAQFQASLSSAQADFEALAALDQQIKSFNVGPNPYTWFTMEALEDTWRNLQKIIKVISESLFFYIMIDSMEYDRADNSILCKSMDLWLLCISFNFKCHVYSSSVQNLFLKMLAHSTLGFCSNISYSVI